MHTCEKTYVKFPRNAHGYLAVRDRFNLAQRKFDKTLKKTKRSYERSKVFELEQANIDNPTEFWKSIARMGPKRSSKIPMEVEGENGEVISEPDEVLLKWKTDFASLFASADSLSESQQDFCRANQT